MRVWFGGVSPLEHMLRFNLVVEMYWRDSADIGEEISWRLFLDSSICNRQSFDQEFICICFQEEECSFAYI